MTRKTIFITGAAGFIGYHAALYFHSRGDRVIGYDNFNAYYNPELKRERTTLLKDKGIDVIKGDITHFEELRKSIEKSQTTHLLHLAAQAGVRYSLTNPKAYLESNIDGFLNILECVRLFPQIPLIYASSSSVYGLNQKIPFSENDSTDNQASLYGVTKKSNELMAQTYHHLFGLSVTGLRFFTVYGPWGRPDMAYYSFTKDICEGRPITLFNEGKMKRDFTYIDDIVSGIASAVDTSYPCEIFNLGNNHPEELLSLVSLIEKALGKKADLHFLPMQQGDVVSTFADIEKSRSQLNFFPKISLEEGINRFVQWYLKP